MDGNVLSLYTLYDFGESHSVYQYRLRESEAACYLRSHLPIEKLLLFQQAGNRNAFVSR